MTPRLVLLTTYFRPIVGGVESNAEQLARYLQSNGFEVLVLTKRVSASLPDRETLDGVRVQRIGPLGSRNARGKWRLLPHATAWLISHRRDHDVVCCIDFRGVGLAALAARVVTKRPVLFQAQTPGVFKWPVRAAYRHADVLACIGRDIEREALALGIPRERVHFLPNAIDLIRFRPPDEGERDQIRRSLNIPLDRVVCAFVGRLSLEKGLMDLMEAWRLLQSQPPEAQPLRNRAMLLVAGPDMDGNRWNVGPSAREFAHRHGLSESVRFLGSVRDPSSLLRAADVFVQPSHFEAQGLAAVEALGCGVPVVASAVGGLLDFMNDGHNGKLSPPQDPPALAKCLRLLIDDHALRGRLAAAARPSIAGGLRRAPGVRTIRRSLARTGGGSFVTLASWKQRFPLLFNGSYATASAGSAVLLLVLLVIAGRWLSIEDYGRFQYALGLATIVETIMDIGLGPVTVRMVARDKAGAARLFRNVLGLKLVWVALGLIVLAVVAPILRSDPVVVRVCYLIGVSSAVRSYLLTTRGLLQGLDRFDIEALLVVCDRMLLLVTGAGVLLAGHGIQALALAFVASRVTMLVVVMALVGRFLGPIAPRVDRAAWRELQSAALPLGFFMIALNTYTYIDTVILGVMRSDTEVGWYTASYRVYEGLTYAPSILAAVLTPRLSYLFVSDRQAHGNLLRKVLLAAVALGVVLGGLGALFASPILTTVFGVAYAPGTAPLQILAGGSLFVFSTWILHAAAISTNLDRRLLITTVVGLASNVALNLVLIPRWGISGAAWATVIAEALTVVLLFVQVKRRLAE